MRGEARAGREACVGRRAEEAGTVLRLHAGELLRNLPEEYFFIKVNNSCLWETWEFHCTCKRPLDLTPGSVTF